MKKIFALLVFACLLFPALVAAQTINQWYYTTTGTLAWDAVAKVDTTDDANRYQVLWRTDFVSAGTNVGNPITAIQLALTIPVDVIYYFGVKAMRYRAGAWVSDSSVSWSSDPTVVSGGVTFGFNTWRKPGNPSGVRLLNP